MPYCTIVDHEPHPYIGVVSGLPFYKISINDANQLSMKSFLLVCKRHIITIVFYLLHTLLCINLIIVSLDKNSAIHGPDGGLPYVFMAFITIILTLVNILNAAFRRRDKRFYLAISLLMIVQIFIVFYAAK